MCLCLSACLSVCSSDSPTGRQVVTWRAPPTSVAVQQWEVLELACVCVCVGRTVIVRSRLCSRGRHSCDQQVLSGVRSPILHSSGSLPAPCPHSATDWSEVITGPLWLNTRDIK